MKISNESILLLLKKEEKLSAETPIIFENIFKNKMIVSSKNIGTQTLLYDYGHLGTNKALPIGITTSLLNPTQEKIKSHQKHLKMQLKENMISSFDILKNSIDTEGDISE